MKLATRSLLLLLASASLTLAIDVTSMLSIKSSPLKFNSASGTYDTVVSLRNNQKGIPAIAGPFLLSVKVADPNNGALLNPEGVDSNDLPYITVPVSDGLLSPKAEAKVALQFTTKVPTQLAPQFFVDATPLTAANSATIEVHGFDVRELEDLSEMTSAPEVGKGFIISVDELERGATSKKSRRIVVPISATSVRLTRPPSLTGSTALPDLEAGEIRVVNVPVSGDGEYALPATVTMDEARQGVFPSTSNSVTVRLRQNGRPVVLKKIDQVSLYDRDSDVPVDLKSLFSAKSNGSLVANAESFHGVLGGAVGKQRLVVRGLNSKGQIFGGELSFYVSRYRAAAIVTPASGSAAPVANVAVKLSLLNGSLQITARSDNAGEVVLPELPAGAYTASAAITSADVTYAASGEVSVNDDSLITFTIGNFDDQLNGRTGVSLSPLSEGGAFAPPSPMRASNDPARIAQHQASLRAGAQVGFQVTPVTSTSVNASASASSQNVPVTGTASITVPKGTASIQIKYTVATAEYPTYVLANSIYNDRWSVSVLASSGGSLISIVRQINSQLVQDPVWLPNGSTGQVTEQINVASLTANGPIEVGLRVTATNIGDSLLSTSVAATLSLDGALSIDKITPDTIAPANGHLFYSIPRPGAKNDRQRGFTLNISKPAGITLEKIKVEVNGTAGLLMKTLEKTIPSGTDVELVSETSTSAVLKVRGTILDPVSTVSTDPPPTRNLVYVFTLQGKNQAGQDVTATKSLGGRRSLWRMPVELPRFGTRDPGEDDWSARGTYNWLSSNSSLITRINDISGEHGRYIGHNTHARGTDIDIFHFYTFPGVNPSALGAGNLNYTALVAAVQLAGKASSQKPPAGATEAKERVTAWVSATRDGCDLITDRAEVAQLIYAAGGSATGLDAGWAQALLTTGKTKVSGKELDLGVGPWAANKMAFNQIHNDHLHITLDRSQIGEAD